MNYEEIKLKQNGVVEELNEEESYEIIGGDSKSSSYFQNFKEFIGTLFGLFS